MLQLTSRDEAMLDWMNVVRLADVDAIRWALSAYQDDHEGPVSVRRANHWIARMAELGYLGRVRPMYRDRQIVWPTHKSSGRAAPRLFRQTMRHELAVAVVSGHYLAAGFSWHRDQESSAVNRHKVDGLALQGDTTHWIEVELTLKTLARYQRIAAHHSWNLGDRTNSLVVYFCTPSIAATLTKLADQFIFRDQRRRLLVLPVLDDQGRVVERSLMSLPWRAQRGSE